MNTRAMAIGLFSLFLSQHVMAVAAQTKCEIELISRERFLFREVFKRPTPLVRAENQQNSDVFGVTVDGRPVLDVAKGGGANPTLLSLRWSGRLSARKTHDFLSKVFPVPGGPRLVFTYQDDGVSEFITEGVPKMGPLYVRILKHNLQNWRQMLSRQEGELRVRVDGDEGPLRSLLLQGDLNHVGRKDEATDREADRAEKVEAIFAATEAQEKERLEAELAEYDAEPRQLSPAMVMLQVDRALLTSPKFREALVDLVDDTADDPALFNNPADVVEVVRQSLPN